MCISSFTVIVSNIISLFNQNEKVKFVCDTVLFWVLSPTFNGYWRTYASIYLNSRKHLIMCLPFISLGGNHKPLLNQVLTVLLCGSWGGTKDRCPIYLEVRGKVESQPSYINLLLQCVFFFLFVCLFFCKATHSIVNCKRGLFFNVDLVAHFSSSQTDSSLVFRVA